MSFNGKRSAGCFPFFTEMFDKVVPDALECGMIIDPKKERCGRKVIKVNGKDLNISGRTVSEYLAEAGYDEKRVAVEINGEILPKSKFSETVPSDGDIVEVVSFVGGG